ncbi:hypothetical protein ILUMI_12152 [Ignelater luminosus]|uniref:ADP/ATP translocase n=1 Tax=Ignelater luminosus TaxID=2038154 RepID=A0A8K0CUS5_IGNLU|nr:hypothetical protein ILUMI_12152 [Ignelater luminosus]
MTYRALYFGLFDSFKQFYSYDHERTKPSVLLEFFFAQTVTTTAGLVTYPFDTVGRRLMLDSGRNAELKVFNGTLSAFRLIYVNEGFPAFYKGALTNCIRGICGALVLVLYDEFLHLTKWKDKVSRGRA